MRGAAARFSVGPSSAIKFDGTISRDWECGTGPLWRSPPADLVAARGSAAGLVAERPDITLAEIGDELRRQRGLSVCLATIYVRLHRLGLRFKKTYGPPRLPTSAGPGADPLS